MVKVKDYILIVIVFSAVFLILADLLQKLSVF